MRVPGFWSNFVHRHFRLVGDGEIQLPLMAGHVRAATLFSTMISDVEPNRSVLRCAKHGVIDEPKRLVSQWVFWRWATAMCVRNRVTGGLNETT